MEEKIEIVKNNICIDIQRLKDIIINQWQSGELYKDEYDRGHRGELLYGLILSELSDHINGLIYETERIAQKNLGKLEVGLDWSDEYPKSDARSIGFEVLNKLLFIGMGDIGKVTTDDIPFILEFLDTPPDKSLEAWDKWEKYWDNLDYATRRRKLLENAEE